jgi:hypothetical protein
MMLSRSDAIRRRKIAPPVLIAALLGVIAAGAAGAAPFMGGHMLEWARVWAIVIAGLLAAAGQMATGALTPAGGATALVVALGAESADWRGVLHLGVGWCW